MKRIALILCCAVVAMLFVACEDELETTSISERIDQLESDLNNDRLSAYQNLHPDNNDRNLGARTEAYWNNVFPGGPYTLTITSTVGSTVTTSVSPTTVASSAEFVMKEDGEDNWKILTIDFPIGDGLDVQMERVLEFP
jgi:ABC-type Fe3+-hydroxamate transport system substrate-binding protein